MYFRKLARGDDCRTKLKEGEIRKLADSITKAMERKGYKCYADVKGTKFELRGCRLNERRIKRLGHNISPYTGHRGRILGWQDWVIVNNTVNQVMDKKNLCGKVDSMHGKFKVRDGKEKYTEEDWEDLAYENVGSMMTPVERREAWIAEKHKPKNYEPMWDRQKRQMKY